MTVSSPTLEAPTIERIVELGASLSVFCAHCRELRSPNGLAQWLIATGKGRTRVDQLVFRCQLCGGEGQPWVNAPGNLTLGRPRLWPPEPPE